MVSVRRRIVVSGPTGSGKTTVASRIASRIDAPHIELDAIFWAPHWTSKPLEQFRAEVSALLNGHNDGWVFDGNYSRVRDLILPLADTIVWLRPLFPVAFWRLLRRTLVRCRSGELLWGANCESWRQSFLSRESLLLYQITNWRSHHKRTRRDLDAIRHQASVLELRSAPEVEKFVASLYPAERTG